VLSNGDGSLDQPRSMPSWSSSAITVHGFRALSTSRPARSTLAAALAAVRTSKARRSYGNATADC
jgi:hypothetical protein